MLEIWRSLPHLVDKGLGEGMDFLRIGERIDENFEFVLRKAAHEGIQLHAEKDITAETTTPVIDWAAKERMGYLDAGLHLFRHLKAPARFSLDLEVE